MLDARKLPSQLLEYSDVELCEAAGEPDVLWKVPEELKFLMLIGTHLLFRSVLRCIRGSVQQKGDQILMLTVIGQWSSYSCCGCNALI
jgi:hypothetical protein